MRHAILGFAAALLAGPGVADTLEVTSYEERCEACGVVEQALDSHDFCALTSVASGGQGSACTLRQQGDLWILAVTDARLSDGEDVPQYCRVGCFDLVAAVPIMPPKPAESIDWNDSASAWRGETGEQYHFRCPAWDGARLGGIWGTGMYTDDSAICVAAVHAGAFSFETGGTVAITIQPGQVSYVASASNGVESSSYGKWDGSFSIDLE